MEKQIEVFTDGSCHTRELTGAWVAIICTDGNKKILQGLEHQTTHHRMELTAVIQVIAYLDEYHTGEPVTILTDSQYVTGLVSREAALTHKNFMTRAGKILGNADLIRQFYTLLKRPGISFIKIKAHQRNADTPYYYHEEADCLSRSLVRQAVKALI